VFATSAVSLRIESSPLTTPPCPSYSPPSPRSPFTPCHVVPSRVVCGAVWNYLNERFYSMLPSQLLFGMSELYMAALLAALSNKNVAVHPLAMWSVVGISGVHAIRSYLDQSNPKFSIALLAAADWVLIAAAVVYIWAAVGTTQIDLTEAIGRVWSSAKELVAGSGGSAADSQGSSAAAADGGSAMAGRDDEAGTKPGPPAGSLSLQVRSYTYTRSHAVKHAAVTVGAIITTLLLLPLTGWF